MNHIKPPREYAYELERLSTNDKREAFLRDKVPPKFKRLVRRHAVLLINDYPRRLAAHRRAKRNRLRREGK